MDEHSSLVNTQLTVRQLGLRDYQTVLEAMHQFTDRRNDQTIDEIWLVQHPPVFTQGQVGKAEHLLCQSDIPVIRSDRGGQITYHGPGQQVMYVLLDIKRKKGDLPDFNVRYLVSALEQCVVKTLAHYHILAYPKADAPGVYVNYQQIEHKICSLGLRIRKGCCFHGLALNINMDLSPFLQINPCGYAGLQMCQLSQLIQNKELICDDVAPLLINCFCSLLNYSKIINHTNLNLTNNQ